MRSEKAAYLVGLLTGAIMGLMVGAGLPRHKEPCPNAVDATKVELDRSTCVQPNPSDKSIVCEYKEKERGDGTD